MESEAREPTGVTRGQNAVHVMPLDWSALPRVLGTLVERIDVARPEPQLLVVTTDAESAAAAASAHRAHGGRARGSRARRHGEPSRRAPAAVGAPARRDRRARRARDACSRAPRSRPGACARSRSRGSTPSSSTPEAQPLENLFAELPKEGARVVLASAVSPAHEALVERYARRARRESEPAGEPGAALSAEYVAAPEAGRAPALRRLLDALDLPAAVLYARDGAVRDEATRVARSLGYPADAVRAAASAADAGGK